MSRTPELLAEQLRRVNAMRQMFEGLEQEYVHALTRDRLEAWGNAAHAIIDYLATEPALPRDKRKNLP